MGKTRERELRERVAHYWSLRRMALDEHALKALDHLIAEAEAQLQLNCSVSTSPPKFDRQHEYEDTQTP